MSLPSNTGAGPLNLRNGKDDVGLFVGDWARKYERMGELPGDGMAILVEEFDKGVPNSEGELAVPDEDEDMDADRALAARSGDVAMGMGSECLASIGFLVDILCDVWELVVRKKGVLAYVADLYTRPFLAPTTRVSASFRSASPAIFLLPFIFLPWIHFIWTLLAHRKRPEFYQSLCLFYVFSLSCCPRHHKTTRSVSRDFSHAQPTPDHGDFPTFEGSGISAA